MNIHLCKNIYPNPVDFIFSKVYLHDVMWVLMSGGEGGGALDTERRMELPYFHHKEEVSLFCLPLSRGWKKELCVPS